MCHISPDQLLAPLDGVILVCSLKRFLNRQAAALSTVLSTPNIDKHRWHVCTWRPPPVPAGGCRPRSCRPASAWSRTAARRGRRARWRGSWRGPLATQVAMITQYWGTQYWENVLNGCLNKICPNDACPCKTFTVSWFFYQRSLKLPINDYLCRQVYPNFSWRDCI